MDIVITPKCGHLGLRTEEAPLLAVRLLVKIVYSVREKVQPKCVNRVSPYDSRGPPKTVVAINVNSQTQVAKAA